MRVAERKPSSLSVGLPETSGFCLRIPTGAVELPGFRTWAHSPLFPDRGSVSFLGGEIFIDMSPEELESHNKVKEAIGRGIGSLNEECDAGEFFADGVLVTNTKANLATEPDGTFISWDSLQAGRVKYIPRKDKHGQFVEIQGSPDWLLEVVSQFSVAKDTKVLPALYHRAKVPEFWLVDARAAEISFQILVYQPKKYQALAPTRGWTFSPVFQRSFRLTRKPNRMGRWRYKLEIRGSNSRHQS
jgi:Uma2 family endonuclease